MLVVWTDDDPRSHYVERYSIGYQRPIAVTLGVYVAESEVCGWSEDRSIPYIKQNRHTLLLRFVLPCWFYRMSVNSLEWSISLMLASLALGWSYGMMTSSNGNIFRATGPLRGEFTGHQWIPSTKASDAELWCLFDLRPDKRLGKQSRRWWFETPSRSLWRHCNDCPSTCDRYV